MRFLTPLFLLLAACGQSADRLELQSPYVNPVSDGNAFADADTDADSDSDTDADTDSDTDADTDLNMDRDGDGYETPRDCDDGNAAVHPGATELCNGIDDDCDGLVDDADTGVQGKSTFYVDADADSYGGAQVKACSQPGGTVLTSGDCNDAVASVHPNAIEACNAIDDDCDNAVDEGGVCSAPDNDGDGYPNTTDCDDNNAAVNPGATEICGDGIDNDCSGGDATCAPADADGDGYNVLTDCNDSNPNVHPGAVEICGNGVDEDCSGADQVCAPNDNDGDGYNATVDCNDNDSTVHPGATEICGDGIDNDCSGGDATCTVTDADGDGFEGPAGNGADCDDSDPDVHPGAVEVCDNVDNDCDGDVDDEDSGVTGRETWWRDTDGDGFGDPDHELLACDEPNGYTAADADGDGVIEDGTGEDDVDCNDSDDLMNPAEDEVMDIRDNDCDGKSDEDGLKRLYRCYTNHSDVAADIDGNGVSEVYTDLEHWLSTSSSCSGGLWDGSWIDIYPTTVCSGAYAPYDGCVVNADGTLDLWGGSYALAGLAQCRGVDPYGLHLTLVLQKDGGEYSAYHANASFTCTDLGYVPSLGGAAFRDLIDPVVVSAHAGAPYYGAPVGSNNPGDVMYSVLPVEGTADGYTMHFPVWGALNANW